MDVSKAVGSTPCPNSSHATTTPQDITSLTSQPHNIPSMTSLHCTSDHMIPHHITWHHITAHSVTQHHVTWHAISQPTTEGHLTFHQPHYSTLPRQSHDIIPQHSTSLPRKHNRPQPTLHHQIERINAGAHQKHWVWALWCTHSFAKFFLWLIGSFHLETSAPSSPRNFWYIFKRSCISPVSSPCRDWSAETC